MHNPKLFTVVNRLAQENMHLQPGERVCVVTDTERLPLAQVFLDVAAALDTDPVLVLMAPRAQHGREVPEVVATAMEGAQVVFQVVTHAMTHTDATQRAMQAGARIMVLRGVTEDLMLHGAINADYQQIAATCARVAERMQAARDVRIRTPQGTDLRLSLEGRSPHILDGLVKGPGTFAAMPDGETAISPLEGSTQGTLVVEHTMDGLGLLDQPIRMEVVDGRVVSIQGGRAAERLERLVAASDEGARNIAEFAIGANPRARLVGNMAEDKKLLGSVHIAIGDNHVLGGSVRSSIHLDGMLLNPTVEFDGERVIDEGRLLI